LSYGGVIARTWRENLLFSVLLELTYRCNLDCFFCYNDLALAGRALGRERYLSLLAELSDLGVLHLVLSGGEPLAHPDFFAVGARARALGFAVRVKSNGHALRGELARRLRDEIDPFLVEVSLHGATASTHDRQTRVAGSFVRLLDNLAELAALGLQVKLNATLTAWNEAESGAMFDLADRLGLPLQFDPEVTPRDDGDASPLGIRASRQGLARLFTLQRERAERARAAGRTPAPEVAREGDQLTAPAGAGSGTRKHCGAGSSSLTVDPYGNVYPCVQWRVPLGNLHDRSLAEIWTGSPALAEVRRGTERALAAVEALGPSGRLAAFCPGEAARETGRPEGLYAAARERLALHQELAELEGRRTLLPVVR
jgi:MoaA/NifB/PqqE/SkfB family radical SAM enzyme